MNAARVVALILTTGLLLLGLTACGEAESPAVADNATAAPASALTPAPTQAGATAAAQPPAQRITRAPAAVSNSASSSGSSSSSSGAAATAPEATPAATRRADETVSSADPAPRPQPTSAAPAGMIEATAPIESVEIIVAESFPPQYFAHVVSGLPNGCVKFYGYDETREGDTINITITNLKPAPSNNTLACAAVYLTHESSIPLGKDFEPGKEYTVKVNDVVESFVAQ